MDRNFVSAFDVLAVSASLSARRAWIEMFIFITLRCLPVSSLSARRAWIEILASLSAVLTELVALRKESVDRNAAWTGVLRDMHHVALRKESVDRNNGVHYDNYNLHCRSPQGERG